MDKKTVTMLVVEKRFPTSLILFFLSILISYIILNLYLSGTIFTNALITKGNFYKNYSKLPYVGNLSSMYLKLIVFILGIIYFSNNERKINKKISLVLFLLAIFSKIAIGEKFYGIYTLCFYFFLYKLFFIFKNIRNPRNIPIKYILVTVLIFCIFFIFTYQVGYVHSSKLDYLLSFSKQDTALDALLSRALSLQAHTWWGIDKQLISSGKFFGDLNQLCLEIKAAITNVSVFDKNIGLVRIMYIVAPEQLVDGYVSAQTRFYGGYWTVFVSSIGYVGVFFMSIIMAYIFALVYHTLYIGLKKKNILVCCICLIYAMKYYEFFRIGNLSILFSKQAIICLLLILLMNVWNKRN